MNTGPGETPHLASIAHDPRQTHALRGMRIEVYEDKLHQWRWRLCAHNGNILAVSSDSHLSLKSCLAMVGRLPHMLEHALVVSNGEQAHIQDIASSVGRVRGRIGYELLSLDLPNHLVVIENVANILDRAYLREQYEHGSVIALVEPTEHSLALLAAGLGLGGVPAIPAHHAEIIAFHKGSGPSIFLRPITRLRVTTHRKGDDTVLGERILNLEDTPAHLRERLELFVDWACAKASPADWARAKIVSGETSDISVLSDAPQADPNSIWSQTNLWSGTYQIPVPMKTNAGTVNTFFNMTFYCSAVCQFADTNRSTPDTDWYLGSLTCNLNPSNAYWAHGGYTTGWYVDWYKLTMRPVDFDDASNLAANGQPLLNLISSGPSTVNSPDEAVSYTVGQSDSIGGSFGFFGDQLTASVSYNHSWSFDTSHSFVVQSCSINNLSGDDAGTANGHWEFTFPEAELNTSTNQLNPAVNYAQSLFSPVVSCLWVLPTASRKHHDGSKPDGLQVECSIDLQFINAYLQDGVEYYEKYRPSTDNPAAFAHTWTIAFPPTQQDIAAQSGNTTSATTFAKDTSYWTTLGENPAGTLAAGTQYEMVISGISYQKGVYDKVSIDSGALKDQVVWVQASDVPP
jgi:uncharacterized protein YegP (UPF0339 family)